MILDNSHSNEIVYDRPDSYFDKKKIEEKYGSIENWYAQNVRFISTNYNISSNVDETKNEGKRSVKRWAESSPVDQIINNYRYFMGTQENFNFAYLTEDDKGGELPAPYVKGEQIYELVEYMRGGIRKVLNSTKVAIESLEPSKISKKMERVQMIKLKKNLAEFFNNAQEKYGMGFFPEGIGNDIDMDEAVEKVMKSPIDEMEEYGLDLLNDIVNRNRLKDQMMRAFTDCAVGRYCGVYVDEMHGRPYTEVIPPYNLIVDFSNDSDYNEKAEFVGWVSFMTPEEIYYRYDLTDEERELVKDLSITEPGAGFELLNHYNSSSGSDIGFNWWGGPDGRNYRQVAVVTGFWITEVPDDKKVKKGKKGGKDVTPIHGNDSERYSYLRIDRATVIGNAIITDYGQDYNVVYDSMNPSRPMLPVRTFIPNMMMGMNRSVVDRMKKLQDDIDAYEYKIRQNIGKDLGKVYLINGHKLGEGDTVRELVANLKKYGMHVTDGSDGEDPNVLDGQRMVETVDMTLDQNVIRYTQLIQEKERMMKEIINASKVSMGQLTSYVGYGSQQQSISQNQLGMATYYDGFMTYYTYLLQYILNKAKIMLMDMDGEEAAEVMLSEDAIKFFKNTTEFQLEDMMVKVDVEDVIDEQSRQRLLTVAQAMAQNADKTGFDWDDYIELETARTYTELKDKMTMKIKKRKMQQQQQQQMAMLQQQAEAEKQRQFAMQQQQMAEGGRNAREEANLRQRAMQPAIDQEAQIAGEQQRQQQGMDGQGA
jgi:hypothetical protein